MNAEFAGLRALVTGGSSGIGQATALLLASRGCRVTILDRDVSTAAPDLERVAADVSDPAETASAVTAAAEAMGGLDILVNNAGIGAVGTVADNDDDEWRRVFDVNVFGIARVTRAALPWLRLSFSGAIVNTCSIAALNGLPDRALYSASKGAVLSLTLAMAADHVAEGIRVNCVCPGTVATPWVDRLVAASDDPESTRRALDARQAIGRLVAPEEVAHAIAYLASPLAGSTTGTILDVDGGVTRLRVPARVAG